MKTIFLGLLLAAFSYSADVGGVWRGTVAGERPDGTFSEEKPAFLTLKQDGNKITGKAGPSDEETFPLENGVIEGDVVTFDLTTPNATMKFHLKLKDNSLEGDAKAEQDGKKRRALMKFTKV